MEVNKLLTKLKARGDDSDDTDLVKVHAQYKDIAIALPAKDRTSFTLNVLCVLCRNIERIPSWSKSVKDKDLLILAIECAREARGLEGADEAKALAYVFHIHRHIIRKGSNAPPELLLKLSYMPFEKKKLIKEYYKTYWNIVADRITYIERLKTKLPVAKLLPNLAQDVIKIINIFEITQFCSNVLSYVVKKMFLIFNESPKELNLIYQNIFQCIAKADVNIFKTISNEITFDLYSKFSDCICVIIENASKMKYKDLNLDNYVQTCIFIFGHKKDVYACFQRFYLSSFCCIFKEKSNVTDMFFNNLIDLCTSTENEYAEAMKATYPFLSQLVRIYIESGKYTQSMSSVKGCLEFIILLMEKLKATPQLLKCAGCSVETGLHDALRLTFLTKSFITNVNNEVLQSILPTYYLIVERQYRILEDLKEMGCPNYGKCFKKLQADIHNTAITLHPMKQCEFSIKLFNVYLESEVRGPKDSLDKKSISRAFYNKGISELDSQLLDEAMKSAYLSMIFALPESLNTQKYMDLVNNIKSTNSDEEKMDELRCMTSLDVCKLILSDKRYDNLRAVIQDVKFCQLLLSEHRMYMQHWPSVKPISGVCKSLYNLLRSQERQEKEDWIKEENMEDILEALYEVVMDATKIRTFDVDIFKEAVDQLFKRFEEKPPQTLNHKLVYAVLMFMKAEFDLTATAEKHGWNAENVTILDPDKDETDRTIEMEHLALYYALRAVEYMTDIQPELDKCSPVPRTFNTLLHVSQAIVQELLHLDRAVHALQLASICCAMAKAADYGAGYLRNAGAIINYAEKQSPYVDDVIADGKMYLTELMQSTATVGIPLAYVCEVAMYRYKCGDVGSAARMVHAVQARVLYFYQNVERKDYNCDMDLAVGRLMEAQYLLCADSERAPSALSAATAIQRHYLTTHAYGSGWSARHLYACALKSRATVAATRCVRLARALQLWRRARAAAAAALPRASAAAAARLHAALTNTHHASNAQTKIDNRLRFITGQQPSSVIPDGASVFEYTPQLQQHETMLFCICGITPTLPPRQICMHAPQKFLSHAACTCYACDTPACTIITCETEALEASMYFRAKEYKIARNFYNGVKNTFRLAKVKIKDIFNRYKAVYKNACDMAREANIMRLRHLEMEYLIEETFFDLSQNMFDDANENIVQIQEMLAEYTFDEYTMNEISNLMITAAKLKNDRKIRRHSDEDLEEPVAQVEATTPVSKLVKRMETELKIKADEVPKRLKVIKMNLDVADDSDSEDEQEFKVPISKPIKVENMTPKPKAKPKLLQETPKTPQIFFTPVQSTPTEQFFTPMTSTKTYSRRIVKNLENEFLTPNAAQMTQSYMRETARKRSKVEAPVATTKPLATTTKSLSSTTKPLVSATKSLGTTIKPVATTTKPEATATKQVATTTKPEATVTKPVATTTKPVATTTKPVATTTNPVAMTKPKDKKALIRATSPGKLEERPATRSRRKVNDK